MKWTPREIKILREYYGKIPVSQIHSQLLPDRSEAAIRGQAGRLDLGSELTKATRYTPIKFDHDILKKIQDDINVDEVIEALINYQAATKQLSTRVDTAGVTIEHDGPIALALTSDEHVGAVSAMYDTMIETLDLMVATPYLYVGEVGDKIDNYLPTSHVQGMFEAIAPPEVQKIIAERLFGKMRGRWIFMVQGCHDDWSHESDDFDLTKWFAKELGCINLGFGGFINLTVGSQKYVIAARHKYRYNSSFNFTHTVKRMREQIGDFDIGIIGHHHQADIEHLIFGDGLDRVFIRTGSFKGLDRYARSQGYRTTIPMIPTVILFPDVRRIIPFLRLEDACRYMEAVYQ